ncbi:MAG: trimethylamine methyltransferase family protein, partial [Candidatus Puniceispirillum sp.]
VWTHQRANIHFKRFLAEYEQPEMDEAAHDAPIDFVGRRKREGGAPTDF